MKKKKTKTKNKQTKTIFPELISILQTFSRFGKLLGKFQAFFTNSRLCTNQLLIKMRKGRREELKPVQLMHPRAKPVKIISGALEDLNVPAAV